MQYTRLGRLEEKRQKRRLYLSIAGIIAIIALLVVFGIKLLIGFSVLVDNIKNAGPQSQAKTSPNILLPPSLDPLPEATNSSIFSVNAHGKAGATLIIYLNEDEAQKTTIEDDGTATVSKLKAKEGINTVSAKIMDDAKKTSELSNVLTFTLNTKAPIMEIQKPDDNAEVRGDPQTVEVSGKTDTGNRITINDRFVVVQNDGSFAYNYTLSEGNNTLTITATDPAGNKTSMERHVTYFK